MTNEFSVKRNPSDWWFACVDVDIWDDESLSTIDKSVFTVLCIHASVRGRQCKLKIETIAKKAGCSVRSVQNSMKKLIERGIINCKADFHEGRQVSSRFQVVGHDAPCYREKVQKESEAESQDEGRTTCTPPRTTCTGRVQDVHPNNDNSFNDIKDSLTREAELPSYDEMPIAFENGQPVTPEPPRPDNPKEAFTPDDAPEIMKPTAELFLHKTGRKGLTWDEISALQALSASQYPARVQKEIDTAVKRFIKRGQSLHTLTLNYIAESLRYQTSRSATGRKVKKRARENPMNMTSEEIKNSGRNMSLEEAKRYLEEAEEVKS